jgi:plastocyanin
MLALSLLLASGTTLATGGAPGAAPDGGAGRPAGGKVHRVAMKGMVFVPATLALAVGDTVEFVNEDVVPHTATALPHFDTGTLKPKESRRVVPREAGRLPYVCTLHPGMAGTLVVR